MVGLGVGLHPGYGNAQRMYVRRGYVPDGAGVVVDGRSVREGSEIKLDDRPMLRMTKQLRSRGGATLPEVRESEFPASVPLGGRIPYDRPMMSPEVELALVAKEEQGLLRNLMQAYLHDLSEFDGSEPGASGLFDVGSYFDL